MPSTITEFFQELHFLHPLSLLCLTLFLILIYKWRSPNSIPNINTPPSPPRMPIIGNLHQLGTYPYRTLQTLSQKYGDLMLLHLGSKPTIIVSSAEMASQVLKTHDLVFASRPNLSVFRRLLGNGKDILTAPYGEHWRQMRSICVLEVLSVKRVRSFRRVREEEVALMSEKIRGGLSTVNLSEMFVSFSIDVICRVAFGKKYRGDVVGGIDFIKLFNELTELLGGYYIGDFVSWLGWTNRISGVDAKVSKVTSGFDAFFERVLEEHSASRNERNGDEEDPAMGRDFVGVLLEAQREEDGRRNASLDEESIKALILNVFAAGSDTAHITLEWSMSELIRNPRVMKKLQEEVRGVIGNKETVTEDELEDMKYLKAVIKETLRLHPAAPLMAPHESTEDVKINGYNIAAGTLVMVNVWAISRDPTYWDEPETFYPERFLNSPIDYKGHDFQFIPFGSGRRMCPGIAFATANIELVVANLVHQFDWGLPNGADRESLDMMEARGMSVTRKNPLLVVPTPRIG